MSRRLPACLTLLLALNGCMYDNSVEPIYEIPEEAFVVVVPYKEPGFRTRWSNRVGIPLMVHTTKHLDELAEFKVRPIEDVISLYEVDHPDKLSARDVADLCRADYVVECDLLEWDPLAEKHIGTVQGKAKVELRLFEVREEDAGEEERFLERNRKANEARQKAGLPPLRYSRGGKYVATTQVEVAYPDTFMDQYGETFMEQEDAREGLIQATAYKCARLLYEHDEPFDKLKGR